jgi:pyruvate,water dikinase
VRSERACQGRDTSVKQAFSSRTSDNQTMNDKYIGRISEPLLPIYSRFGEKGLRLQKLKQLGFVVPDGLLLSVEFMQYLIRSMGLQGEIDKILEREAKRDANLEARVREILKGKVPEDAIRIPVEEAIRSISCSYSGPDRDSANVLFAVRSAALGEDDETTSFAGQYSTLLNVNLEHIWSAIFECYASWWTERAVSYRATHKMLNTEPRISIIVQLQLNPEYSGCSLPGILSTPRKIWSLKPWLASEKNWFQAKRLQLDGK